MNGLELSPSEPRHTVSVPLTLDIDQRLNLINELRDLSAELEENPFVQPAQSVTELKGITLKEADTRSPASYMSLKIAESDSEPSSASISLTSSKSNDREQYTFIHRPSLNIWEEWHPGAQEALTLLSNASLIGALEPYLPKGSLESIMDSPLQGMEVAHFLADYLKKKARTRTHYERYRAHNIQTGDEFTRDTDFVIDTLNRRVARSLFVAASFHLDDFGHLRKTYRYDVTDDDSFLIKSANGTIHVSSGAHVPKQRLNAFGLRDPIRNDPSNGINVGVHDIRNAYSSS